jgi:NAD(P)-dependent dehydrogenase (short-subunit alcohol dehydrogenase family)
MVGMNTILITGSSSGYGLETARLFAAQGWNVIATMRTPRSGLLPDSVRVLELDVTDPSSIAAAVEAAGPIDVLVNNAGVGAIGAFEATPLEMAREIFDTNTFGVMAVTQAFLPQFRERGAGMIVNVTSSVALARMPLVAVYTASKTAIEGFTASLALELSEFDIGVKLIQPGYGPSTSFTSNGHMRLDAEAYAPYVERVMAEFQQQTVTTAPADVASTVWRAVHDETGQLRFPAGPDAVALAQTR